MLRDKEKDNDVNVRLSEYILGFRNGVIGENYPDPILSHPEYSRGYHDGDMAFSNALDKALERIS